MCRRATYRGSIFLETIVIKRSYRRLFYANSGYYVRNRTAYYSPTVHAGEISKRRQHYESTLPYGQLLMTLEKLKNYITRAERNAARGREIIARQRTLISEIEQDGHDTLSAESILRTLLQSQKMHEDALDRLVEALRAEFPEEWRARTKDDVADVSPVSNEGNRLLNSLSFADLGKLQPFLERVKLRLRQRLQIANRKISDVHFLESGLVAVMAITGAGRCETQVALIGKEGMTGLPIMFGSRQSPFDVVVEVEGRGQCISVNNLLNVMDQSPPVRDVMMAYLHATWLQFAHTTAINAQGTIEERLAHLLIVAQDRLETRELRLTHEQLATLMAVRRAGVTIALQNLEASELIAKDRGHITIVDRAGLEHRVRHIC